MHVCVVNVGHFRSGTTTLATASERLGLSAYRKFPDLPQNDLKMLLQNPGKAILDWYSNGGCDRLLEIASKFDLVCDGWFALLPFLPIDSWKRFTNEAEKAGIRLEFVATTRDVKVMVQSELQHWVIHNLEQRSGLDPDERRNLGRLLLERASRHEEKTNSLIQMGWIKQQLGLDDIYKTWSKKLSRVKLCEEKQWLASLEATGKCNANPSLPVEGVLLTLRLGTGIAQDRNLHSVDCLLDKLEEDHLCRYLVVFAIDSDEAGSDAAKELGRRFEIRAQLKSQLVSWHLLVNPSKLEHQPFAICSVWGEMAAVAWETGADWVVLLGDDIEIRCPYHYRAIYSSFLSISKRLGVPFGFGCPWWNDITFPGFPSFPCIGKAHYEIFGGLIPKHRRMVFVNQDLDPYIHRLYTKFFAAPCIPEACLSNGAGGHVGSYEARYQRVPAQGWKDFISEDIDYIREYLPDGSEEAILVDVVVPSYRVRLDYLQTICSLNVPPYMQTLFIIIVDSPHALVRAATEIEMSAEVTTLGQGEMILENYLSASGNRVRVRCNEENLGASASRNRGLDESTSDFVLNLDDDLIPDSDLLHRYGEELLDIDDDVIGLVGLVRFPRSPMPLKHAAVLMSYLTFMFEIAESNIYQPAGPAWGVTANILFRRNNVRFDLTFAKTGGGEDVDYSLRVTKAFRGGRLLAVPRARVIHPFWPGSVVTLSSHFFNWANGDSGLFERFPEHRYWSFPNVPETFMLFSPLCAIMGPWIYFLHVLPSLLLTDLVVDASNPAEFRHRSMQVRGGDNDNNMSHSLLFYLSGHMLANLYVAVLECGRIRGHLSRKNI